MSVRAYRVITEPVLHQEPSFNLWSDNAIMLQLQNLTGSSVQSSEHGDCTLRVDKNELQRYINSEEVDEAIKKRLQSDINATRGTEITYICF